MGEPDRLTISAETAGADVVFAVEGEVDPLTAPDLEAALQAAPAGAASVALDLRGVSFLDSSGLRVIVSASNRFSQDGVRFVIRDPSDSVLRVLEISGLYEHLSIVRGPDRAT